MVTTNLDTTILENYMDYIQTIQDINQLVVHRYEKKTILQLTVEDCDREAVQYLLEMGASPNVYEKESPLCYAVLYSYYNIAKLLIEYGAEVNDENNYENNPITKIHDIRDKQFFELLIENGANIHILDEEGHNLVDEFYKDHYSDNTKMIDYLYEKGLTITNKVLYEYIERINKKALIEVLIKHNYTLDFEGILFSLLDAEDIEPNVLDLLLEKSNGLYAKDLYNQSFLVHVVEHNYDAILLNAIIKYGVNEIKNHDDYDDVLTIAADSQNNCWDILKSLDEEAVFWGRALKIFIDKMDKDQFIKTIQKIGSIEMLNHELYDQQSIIYYACSKALNTDDYAILDMIKKLLDSGVHPDLTSQGYSTPLLHVVSNLTSMEYFYDDFGTDGVDLLQIVLINLLIDYGADINTIDRLEGEYTSLFIEIKKREGMYSITFDDPNREAKSIESSRYETLNIKGLVNLTEVMIDHEKRLVHSGTVSYELNQVINVFDGKTVGQAVVTKSSYSIEIENMGEELFNLDMAIPEIITLPHSVTPFKRELNKHKPKEVNKQKIKSQLNNLENLINTNNIDQLKHLFNEIKDYPKKEIAKFAEIIYRSNNDIIQLLKKYVSKEDLMYERDTLILLCILMGNLDALIDLVNDDTMLLSHIKNSFYSNSYLFEHLAKNKSKPIHLATYFGHRNIIEYLLSIGANLNDKDDLGRTALFYVNNYEIGKFILEHIDNIDHKDKKGMTPLALALGADVWSNIEPNFKIAGMLIYNGANVNEDEVKIYHAIHMRKYDIIELAIVHGYSQEKLNEALVDGVYLGEPKTVEFLLKCGADIKYKKDGIITLKKHAKQYGHDDIIQILEDFEQYPIIDKPEKATLFDLEEEITAVYVLQGEKIHVADCRDYTPSLNEKVRITTKSRSSKYSGVVIEGPMQLWKYQVEKPSTIKIVLLP